VEKSKILVWDLPVRLFHWLLVASFAGAFVTAESERYRDLHVLLGYTVLGLLVFRLVWALAGTRYARLSSFAFGPKAVFTYLKSLVSQTPMHFVGHNPLGSWGIYAIVALGLVTGITGYALSNDAGGDWIESLHEGAANTMLAVVLVHVIGVIVSCVLHRENLAGAMVTGYKNGKPGEGIGKTRWLTAAALACSVAILWSGVLETPGSFPASPRKEPTSHRGEQHRPQHDAGERDG
jgi:cytochrome b